MPPPEPHDLQLDPNRALASQIPWLHGSDSVPGYVGLFPSFFFRKPRLPITCISMSENWLRSGHLQEGGNEACKQAGDMQTDSMEPGSGQKGRGLEQQDLWQHFGTGHQKPEYIEAWETLMQSWYLLCNISKAYLSRLEGRTAFIKHFVSGTNTFILRYHLDRPLWHHGPA